MEPKARPIRIRQAKPADAEAICKVLAASWTFAYAGIMSPSFLESRLSKSRSQEAIAKWAESIARNDSEETYLVAIDEDEIIGFACGGRKRQERLATDAELTCFYVAPRAHGRGAGRLLISAFAAQMQRLGHRTFGLGCLSANQSGMGFYRHMGGQPVFEIPDKRHENLMETYFEYEISGLVRQR